MPTYMDVHTMDGGVSAADVAGAHKADLETQTSYGVSYKQYWVDEAAGKIFCSLTPQTLRQQQRFIGRLTVWSPRRSTRSRKVPSLPTTGASV